MTTTNTIYSQLEALDKIGDLGNTYLVTPATETVELALGINLTEQEATVIIDGDEPGNVIDWPEGLDYKHQFEPAEFLEAGNWEWNLEDLVADGEPFYVQTVQIDYVTGDGDDTEVQDGVGWALVARTVAHQGELEARWAAARARIL